MKEKKLRKEGFLTQKDIQQGLAEPHGIDMGSLVTEKDKNDMILTEKDRQRGLL